MAAVASFWDTNMAAVTSCERGVLEEIERFHSRGQHPCKFIGTKESIYIRKEFNSQRILLVHQHGRRFIVLDTNMVALTLCENAL